jgi:hypothetical protein
VGGAAKVAAVAAIAIGSVGGGAAVVVSQHDSPAPKAPAAGGVIDSAPAPGDRPAATDQAERAGDDSGRGLPRRGRDHGTAGRHGRVAEQAERNSHGARGRAERESKANHGQGRGPIETPAEDPPVRRGPPEEKAKPEREAKLPKADGNGPSAKEEHTPAATEGKREEHQPLPSEREQAETGAD